MTNSTIKNIINGVNTNPDINWGIALNTPYKIVLTNSYDKCVNYSIRVHHQDGDEWISVRDNHMDRLVGCYLHGHDIYSDYTYIEHGIQMAIEEAVENFNETY